VKNVLVEAPPLAFVFFRFLIAAVACLPLTFRRPSSPGLLRDGAIIGSLLAAGMIFQVLGQTETSASKAAFLTGLSVVLTPFAAFLRTRRLPSLENGVGIALAGMGFILLTLPRGGGPINRGDVLVFVCGVIFAFYIVEIGIRTVRHDPGRLTAVQLAVVAAISGIASVVFRLAGAAVETRPIVWNRSFLASVLYLATIGTVGTFLTQTWAQRHMSATHAAIIFALEPVWAAFLAAWLLAERLGSSGVWGGALVLAGIVVSETRLARRASP
jgi:drug/metabolite transporter (DMT)-like permease